MLTIHKFPVPAHSPFHLDLPHEAKPLTVQAQADAIVLWVLLDADAPLEQWEFYRVGTGWELDPVFAALRHLGTVQQGGFVWHVFV